MAMSRQEALVWARDEAEAGDYLAEYDDDGLDADSDPGTRCGYDDETLDAVGRILRDRGLRLGTDDVGLVAEER